MSSIADLAAALQQAQADQRAVNTRATRKALADAQQALQQSPEAANARRHANRVRLSPW